MATLNLSDKAVMAAKAKPKERLELWDTHTPGLCLRISGRTKAWVVRYRAKGKQRRFVIGDYPNLGIADARIAAAPILRDAKRDGTDPAGERQRAKAETRAQTIKTYRDLADAYMAACQAGHWQPRGKRQSPRTLKDARESLDRYVFPAIGDLQVEDVTRSEVRAFLRELNGRGVVAQANKALAVIRQSFSWAIAEFEGRLVSVNVAAGQLRQIETPRSRVLADDELACFWGGLLHPEGLRLFASPDDSDGEPVHLSRPMAIVLQLALLLLQRRQELAGMMRSEVNLEQALWLAPPERMKARKAHLVPLPPKAVELVREAIELAQAQLPVSEEGQSRPNDFPLFPSPRNRLQPIQPASATHTMKRLTTALGLERATVHDLRRTGSSALTSERLGVSPFIRSLILAHTTDAGGGAAVSMRHYDVNEYVTEKRAALAAWERLLLTIVSEASKCPTQPAAG